MCDEHPPELYQWLLITLLEVELQLEGLDYCLWDLDYRIPEFTCFSKAG